MTRCVQTLIFAVFLMVVTVLPALAQETVEKPSKESVIAAWEETIKTSEYTVKFAPTDKEGVYDFETTLFPFKGALKILNVLVLPPKYDYDISKADAPYVGYIEYDLVGIPDKFFTNHYRGYEVWMDLNTFYYSSSAKKWMTHDEIKSLVGANDPLQDGATCPIEKMGPFKQVLHELKGLIPVGIFLVGFLALTLLLTRKQRKAQMANYNLTIERQLEMLNALKDIRDLMKQGKNP